MENGLIENKHGYTYNKSPMKTKRQCAVPMDRIHKAFGSVKDTDMGDYSLQLVSESDFDRVLAFQRQHFFPDEPISKAIGMGWSNDLKKKVSSVLEQNLSLMAVDPATGEVVGVRMIRVSYLGDRMETDNATDDRYKLMCEILNDMESKCDFVSKYGATETIHFFGLAVNNAYRNKGIGGKLMAAGVKFASELGSMIGVTCLKGEGSSNFSKKIYENLDFDMIQEIPYNDYRLNGNAVLLNTEQHTSYRAYGKRI